LIFQNKGLIVSKTEKSCSAYKGFVFLDGKNKKGCCLLAIRFVHKQKEYNK